jgi:hypothetical protein
MSAVTAAFAETGHGDRLLHDGARGSLHGRPCEALNDRRSGRQASLVLLFAPGDDHQRIVGEWPLKLESFLSRRTHPDIDFLARREDDRHGLRVNCSNYLVRFGRQKREQIIRRLAFLHLSNGSPAGPDAGKECEWSRLVEREPDRRACPIRQRFVL